MDYYSDRTTGPVPRVHEHVTGPVWMGIVELVGNRVKTGAVAERFPQQCDDPGAAVVGTQVSDLRRALQAEIPHLSWPLREDEQPLDKDVFDLVEFMFRNVAEPKRRTRHDFYDHQHLWNFDRRSGRQAWMDDVNRLLGRNGVAFELTPSGRVERLVPMAIATELRAADFSTGDAVLDRLLDEARGRFLDRHPSSRRDAVEKLWDAFERAKTVCGPGTKPVTANRLLDNAASTPEFRLLLTSEARILSELGNEFRIRHSEVSVAELDDRELDYVFVRLFGLLWLLLRN